MNTANGLLEREQRKKQLKVAYLLKLLKANDAFLKSISNSKSGSRDLSLLIDVLKPYAQLSLQDLEAYLGQCSGKPAQGIINAEKEKLLQEAGLPQLRDPRFRAALSREELANLAQRELGVAKSTLMKVGRDDMEKIIENALENVDTLHTLPNGLLQKKDNEHGRGFILIYTLARFLNFFSLPRITCRT